MSGRLRAMRILAAGMAVGGIGFGLFTIAIGFLDLEQAPHAFHNPIVASLLVVLSAPPLIAIARAPERPIRPLGVASLVYGDYASAMPAPLAWALTAGSVLFILVAEWKARRHQPAG